MACSLPYQSDNINRMITLTMIALSNFHCIIKKIQIQASTVFENMVNKNREMITRSKVCFGTRSDFWHWIESVIFH
jgi:hypothetical protein